MRKTISGLLGGAMLVLLVGISLWSIASRPSSAKAAGASPFAYFQEFFGVSGYNNPQAAEFLQGGIVNGLTLTTPVASGMVQLANPYNAGIMLRLPGAASPAGISDSAIETQQANFEAQAVSNPQLNFIWDLMPEWDQSGGAWVPQGRPSYVNLSKAAAYAKFINYYRQSYPALMNYLSQPAGNRKYRISAVTDYSVNTFYAYEM